MALKSTDMAKNMAKKLDGSLKSESLPDRFGQASKVQSNKRERAAEIPASKLVLLATVCQLNWLVACASRR